jgi:hypothetical protein
VAVSSARARLSETAGHVACHALSRCPAPSAFKGAGILSDSVRSRHRRLLQYKLVVLPSSLRVGHHRSSPPSFVPPHRSPLVTVPEPQPKQVVVAARVAGELASLPSCLGKEHHHAMMYLTMSQPPDTLSLMHRNTDIELC